MTLRPSTACSSLRATSTSDAGDASNGASPSEGPSSNEYVVAYHGVAVGVGVPVWVLESVAEDERLLVALLVPVAVLELVAVAVDEAVPV